MLGDWWTLLIVRDALLGTRRFSDFHKNLGLAKNILSTRLQTLVENGIFETRPSPERADRHEYHLTSKGRDLKGVLLALCQWSENHLFSKGEEKTAFVVSAAKPSTPSAAKALSAPAKTRSAKAGVRAKKTA